MADPPSGTCLQLGLLGSHFLGRANEAGTIQSKTTTASKLFLNAVFIETTPFNAKRMLGRGNALTANDG